MILKILNLDYELTYKDLLVDESKKVLHGLCEHDEQTITISASDNKVRQGMTLLHEVLHAYNEQMRLEKEEDCESKFDMYATVFYNFIINNKEIIRNLIK